MYRERSAPDIEALLQHALVVHGDDSNLSIVEVEGEGADLRVDNADLANLHRSADAVERVAVRARLNFAGGRIVCEERKLLLLKVKEQRVLLVALRTAVTTEALYPYGAARGALRGRTGMRTNSITETRP